MFLVDANLPPSLCAWLVAKEHKAVATRDVGLRDSEDDKIWGWAVANGAVIISKDEDFVERRSRSAAGPRRSAALTLLHRGLKRLRSNSDAKEDCP